MKRIQACSNKGAILLPNKIFFCRTSGPISTKLVAIIISLCEFNSSLNKNQPFNSHKRYDGFLSWCYGINIALHKCVHWLSERCGPLASRFISCQIYFIDWCIALLVWPEFRGEKIKMTKVYGCLMAVLGKCMNKICDKIQEVRAYTGIWWDVRHPEPYHHSTKMFILRTTLLPSNTAYHTNHKSKK